MTPSPPPVTQEERDELADWFHSRAEFETREQELAEADALLALGYRKPVARQPQLKLGDRIAYRPGGKYPEWERNGPYYFAGMTVNLSHFMPLGAPNLHVSDRWPIQSPGDVTDGFGPEEWSGVTDVEGERRAAEGRPVAVGSPVATEDR